MDDEWALGFNAAQAVPVAVCPPAEAMSYEAEGLKVVVEAGAPGGKKVMLQSQPSYICGYCGTVKTSQAAGSDGKGVRIRCGCGGKHRDNQPRMHANWKRIAGDGGKTLMARLVPRAVTSPMLQSLQPGPV